MPVYYHISRQKQVERVYREIASRPEQCCFVISYPDGISDELTKAEALKFLEDLERYFYLKSANERKG